ncbi:MAG: hypothetical protein AB7S68_32110 [Polyangiaceae bacterium]
MKSSQPDPPSKLTFSQLSGGARLGLGYYRRHGWELESAAVGPRGVVDALEDLRQPAFDTRDVHPDVRRFFEDTSGLELFSRSHWRGPF